MTLAMTIIIFVGLCFYMAVAIYMLRLDAVMKFAGGIMIVLFLWLIASRVSHDITNHEPVIPAAALPL